MEGTYRHLNKAFEIRPTVEYLPDNGDYPRMWKGNLKPASNYIETALQLDPFSAMNHHFKGFIFYLQEQYEKAFPCFEKSLSLKPDLHFPKLSWGNSLILMGRAAEGLAFFQKLPDDIPGLTKLGGTTLAYIALGDIEKAEERIAKLEAALQTGSMGSAMNYLIYSQTMMDKYDEAIQLIEQGIALRLPMMLSVEYRTDRQTPPFYSSLSGVDATSIGNRNYFQYFKKKI